MTSSHPSPPQTLEEPLEIEPADWDAQALYFLLTGIVVPRPIAWVSTLDPGGVANVAPHSYFNVVASDPPHVMFSSSGVKDTLRNARASGEFVVNIVSMDAVEEMNFSATDFPPNESEFEWAGLDTAPAAKVRPPRVARAKAHLECVVEREIAIGTSFVVIGRVVHVHVDPSVWSDGRVAPELLDPVCRLAGTSYARLGNIFKLPRPTWKDVEGTPHGAAMPRLDEG